MSQSVHTKHRGSPPSHQHSVQHVLALDGGFPVLPRIMGNPWKMVSGDRFSEKHGSFSTGFRLILVGRVRDLENFSSEPPQAHPMQQVADDSCAAYCQLPPHPPLAMPKQQGIWGAQWQIENWDEHLKW